MRLTPWNLLIRPAFSHQLPSSPWATCFPSEPPAFQLQNKGFSACACLRVCVRATKPYNVSGQKKILIHKNFKFALQLNFPVDNRQTTLTGNRQNPANKRKWKFWKTEGRAVLKQLGWLGVARKIVLRKKVNWVRTKWERRASKRKLH